MTMDLLAGRRGGAAAVSGRHGWRLVSLLLAMSFLASLLASCDPAETRRPDDSSPAANATQASLLPTTVSALPSFDWDTYERLLYQLRGTPVVVNIWASWCGPCRKEAPILTDAAKRYGDRIQFLGVDYQDQAGTAAAYAERFRVPYPSVADAGPIHDNLGFVGLPDTVFYSASGAIVGTWSGPLTEEALSRKIAPLIPG
jgi:cytochrome c biogenesis protein CcmG, thiol:disulfide interchange protein DsbE